MLNFSEILNYTYFGLLDNGILAAVTVLAVVNAGRIRIGWKRDAGVTTTQAALGGAMVGNTLSDAAAGLSLGLNATLGITLGCVLAFVVLPACASIIRHFERRNA